MAPCDDHYQLLVARYRDDLYHFDPWHYLPYALQLEGACVPAPSFLRVRELVDGRPGKILKQSGHTLRYMYSNYASYHYNNMYMYEGYCASLYLSLLLLIIQNLWK